jgi:serine/threonine protein kinase
MGVFHRGITLENIFLTGNGHLVVSDFRNSKINYNFKCSAEDETAQALMSLDAFRDYYAMIKVYYEMVTGNVGLFFFGM